MKTLKVTGHLHFWPLLFVNHTVMFQLIRFIFNRIRMFQRNIEMVAAVTVKAFKFLVFVLSQKVL